MSEQDAAPEVVLDATHVTELEERSDIDHHLPERELRTKLGEDWGDGFYVDPEPVLVQRGPDGRIVRTTPLSEIPGLDMDPDDDVEAYEPDEIKHRTHGVIPASEREKLAWILTKRLFEWYKDQPPDPLKYNPLYDGVPGTAPHVDHALQPLPGSKLYPASGEQVFQYLYKVVGSRIEIVNKKRGLRGHRQDLAENFAVRIKRE